jgi:hypothetical protein
MTPLIRGFQSMMNANVLLDMHDGELVCQVRHGPGPAWALRVSQGVEDEHPSRLRIRSGKVVLSWMSLPAGYSYYSSYSLVPSSLFLLSFLFLLVFRKRWLDCTVTVLY